MEFRVSANRVSSRKLKRQFMLLVMTREDFANFP